MALLPVPALRISVLLPQSSTLPTRWLAVRKRWVGRRSSWLQNSWHLRSMVRNTRYPRPSQTYSRLEWLYSRYARGRAGTDFIYGYFIQVLTGEVPFREFKLDIAAALHLLRGNRPQKPEDASAIGFSDSLWAFTERCWDDNVRLRPEVGEVVRRLGEAAADWSGLTPPCARASGINFDSQETSPPGGHSESGVLVPL